jgi:hypothetical protein
LTAAGFSFGGAAAFALRSFLMRLVDVSVAIDGICNNWEYLPHGLALETPVHAPADTRVHDIAQLLRGKVEKLLEGNSSVGVGAEGALLLELGSRGGILTQSQNG